MMPADALEALAGFDAIFLGAVGHPEIHDHVTLNELLLPIRRRFDQYVCLHYAFLGMDSPLKKAKAERSTSRLSAKTPRVSTPT